MIIDWTQVSSAVAAIVAVVALIISCVQLKQSNKQQLFDRRLSIWIHTNGLIQLIANHEPLLTKKADGPEFSNDLQFQWLTNNTWLCEVTPAIVHVMDPELQRTLLIKLEELKKLSLEASLVFKGKPARLISEFVFSYQALLFSMYQYQITLESLHKTSEKFHLNLEQAINTVGEDRQRETLHIARSKLMQIYSRISDEAATKRIEKQCRLIRASKW